MRLISFDIGIKNMAYCVFDIIDNVVTILDWNILNLMPSSTSSLNKPLCLGEIVSKTTPRREKNKHLPIKKCDKIAKYKKGEQYFCDKHAKNSSYIINEKLSQLKKLKIEELVAKCNQYLIFSNDEKIPIKDLNKKELLECLQKKILEPIKILKTKNADETDLITLGRNMTELLNGLEYIKTITHVIIENQISPIANRMKTIQGMLCQYFIMNGSPNIEFISSMNKLKGFVVEVESKTKLIRETPETTKESNEIVVEVKSKTKKEELEDKKTKDKQKYKKRKNDGIIICSQFLEKNENIRKWKHCLDNVKKDDYADSFLQGIWYLTNKKLITHKEFIIGKETPPLL